jgi:glutamate/tyrosine decarboxylase-like PLP-dependent enzyme
MASSRDSLDPEDWAVFRAQAHRMLDDIVDYVETIRRRPVWRPVPEETRAALREPLPRAGRPLEEVHARFLTHVLPFATGNVHPRFMGWVHGGGNVYGMLGELLAAGLNANLGGRDHAPIDVEKVVVRWFADLFGFPAGASGLLVTGTSIANLIGVIIARVAALGPDVRRAGAAAGPKLVAYASTAVHGCVPRAMDMAGLGTDALRLVPVGASHRIDVARLSEAIAQDRAAGLRPFLVVGTAGTVDVGAFDDLEGLARVCRAEGLWLHVDGAFGALGVLAPEVRPSLAGLEKADSVAFDFHKWGQVPYDAACIVVRDEAKQLAAFSSEAAYLRREARGLAGGMPWPCDLGPDLSRGFRALKVWYTLEVLGADRLGAAIARTCALARRLAARVDAEPELERLAPVPLNIVCFRYRFGALAADPSGDEQNAALAADLQESGVAAPSTTTLDGRLWLRCAIVNHRTEPEDVDALVDAVLAQGRRRRDAAASPA